MRKLFLIARSNLRKAKGQAVAIVALILISAMLLNLWLMLALDYRANFDRYHQKLNAEHVTLTVDETDGSVRSFLESELTNDNKVSDFGLDDCMHMVGSLEYNGGEMNSEFIFTDKETALTRKVGKAEIVEDGNETSGVYLPMLYKSDDYSIGKPVDITVRNKTVTYTICGFFNSVMLGSHNCAMMQIILTADKYEELENTGYATSGILCSVRLKNPSDNLNYEASLKSTLAEQFPNVRMASNNYDIVSQARYISQGVSSGVMSTMAFLVLLIAIVVIVSNIVNYIQINLKNLGALKAVGYTSGQLICSLLLQFLGLTLIAAIVGSALSYAVFPAVNSMMIAQTGIPYAITFLPLPILISVLILGGAVALAVWLSALRIKKIEPIVALRSGVQTHNFKRNRVPLEKTKAPVNFALALKSTLSGVKNNITVCITMLVLSLVVVFSGLMTENIIVDSTPFLNLIVGETADSCISVQSDIESQFLDEMNADGRVEKVYLYNSVTVSHAGGAELMATMCDDFSLVNNKSVVFTGKFPTLENEIALAAKYANEKGFKVGQEIEISANGKTEKYLICGFTQITNNLGRDCLFTRAGYERLGKVENASYYLNLAKGVDIDGFNADIKDKFADGVNAVINVKTTIDGASEVYISLITVIVIAILILSVLIIAFVLFLLVRTMLNNKQRDYGILKSLGYTTGQLVAQTAISFMPAVIISTIVGLVIGCLTINPLLSLFFSSLGIVKCTFDIPIAFTIIAGAALMLLAFGLACLLSLKIKKISPHSLLTSE